MTNKQVVSSLLLLLLNTELVSASNRPGSGGGCDGEAPILLPGQTAPNRPVNRPNNGGGNSLINAPSAAPSASPSGQEGNVRKRFLSDVANPAHKRSLQEGGREFISDEDIALCCSGNGDFEFLMRDLDVDGLSVATEADGFLQIPGDSRWTCRTLCRDEAIGPDLETCYAACECRQNCPLSEDFLTQECLDTRCNFEDELQQVLCLENCWQECGERCRSTFNGYIVPLDIYSEGLKILDCYHGDLIGDATGSCDAGQAFWQQSGFSCEVTEGNNFDCQCDDPGDCLNLVYPCDYDFYCTSNSPSLVPSASPSDVPSTNPSSVPSYQPSSYPTLKPTPRPTKGKGGSKPRDDDDDWRRQDDDDRRLLSGYYKSNRRFSASRSRQGGYSR